MTIHLSARLAWHDSGWNGCLCRDPKANTYCVGPYSFPADYVARERDLDWEAPLAGHACAGLDKAPPCMYGINAFGDQPIAAYVDPPSWFGDGTERRRFEMPPATVATWPYEEMYKDEVINPDGVRPHYNPVKRREAVNAYFGQIEPNRSLIIYYANYSNPFSEGEQNRYVVVGLARVKQVGPELLWSGQSEKTLRERGPNAWFRTVTSHYPDQGLRIPYHLYLDRPEVLERILLTPENPRSFKYASRHVSDDDCLSLVERLSEIVGVLDEIGDTSENWAIRQAWLASLMAELWQSRGLYPGLLRVCDYLRFDAAIRFARAQVGARGEQAIKDAVFAYLEGRTDALLAQAVDPRQGAEAIKRWRYLEPGKQALLRDVLPLFDLQTRQIQQIMDKPESCSVEAPVAKITENPYTLCEQYVGSDPDDRISFSAIDHGLFPSPELGATAQWQPDDWRRLRALCVDELKKASQHTFLPAEQVLEGANHRLDLLPEWKRAHFALRHLEVEQPDLEAALTYRRDQETLYLYLRGVFDDERLVEATLRELASRSDITLRSPVTEGHWGNFLRDPNSEIARDHPSEYEAAIAGQVAACQRVFRRPVSVICGAAGTGKTTVVEAIIKAIQKAHGEGASFQLLAPTGKAADRLRDRTKKEAATIHSFLARLGWLNDNLAFRRQGGRRDTQTTTFIIDESSMLDLPLLATLFRAVNWNAVQRLVFVGDPSQLPPIGTSKVFADLIDWLGGELPEHMAELETNMRQLCNRLTGQGTGILDLASLYVRRGMVEAKSADDDARDETMLAQLQEGGDIDGDLRVLYWNTPDELEQVLLCTIVADMSQDTGLSLEADRPDKLWDAYLRLRQTPASPERSQVLSPYRGERYGIEHLNLVLQGAKNRWMLDHKGSLGGITYGDKAIQTRNRSASNPVWAFSTLSRKHEKAEVFNGEIGYVKVHGFGNYPGRGKKGQTSS